MEAAALGAAAQLVRVNPGAPATRRNVVAPAPTLGGGGGGAGGPGGGGGGGGPPAPHVPPAQGSPMLPLGAPAATVGTRPYRQLYADNARDPYVGFYPAVFSNYEVTAINTPAVVRDNIFTAGNSGTPIGQVLLVAPPGTAAPGFVQGYHRIVRYQPSLVGANTFDNISYAFMGDIINGQAPHTVIWRQDYFEAAPNTQVPTSAYLDQLLAADPNLETVGPFTAGTPDTEQVQTRMSLFVPNRYMTILLDDVLTPRQAWTRIRGAIVADGLAQECEPLIDWLRVAITARQANQNSSLAVAVPASQNLANLSEANRFQAFRTEIIDRDHPNLRTNLVTQGAANIATSIGALADQTRLQRESDNLRRARETNKGPSDLFPVGLQKLM